MKKARSRHGRAAEHKPAALAEAAEAGTSPRRGSNLPSPASGMDPRLAAAIARGKLVRQQMSTVGGGSVSSAQAACLLRVSKGTVLHRWRAHRVVGWKQD